MVSEICRCWICRSWGYVVLSQMDQDSIRLLRATSCAPGQCLRIRNGFPIDRKLSYIRQPLGSTRSTFSALTGSWASNGAFPDLCRFVPRTQTVDLLHTKYGWLSHGVGALTLGQPHPLQCSSASNTSCENLPCIFYHFQGFTDLQDPGDIRVKLGFQALQGPQGPQPLQASL